MTVRVKNMTLSNLGQRCLENVAIKKLNGTMVEDKQLYKHNSLAISKDESGTSKGFEFVNFDDPDDARKAVEAMNGSPVGSKTLYVARAHKKVAREQLLKRFFEQRRREQIMKFQDSNVYVKNIEDDISDNELHELFSQYGTITSTKIMRDEEGVSKDRDDD
ncbi:hypothetical protein P3S67_003143 [Capsicum chacoense]